ncbi:MAG: LuxR C-terminal-related transcriptional regulator [Solirubrobacteraceae bacterium]
MDLLQAEVAFAQKRGSDAPLLLLQAARKLETLDVRLSRNTYLDAWAAALFAGRLASAGGSLLDVSRAVVTAPAPAGPPLACDLLLDGLGLVFTEGRPAATPVLRRAVAAFASTEVSVEEMLRWGWLATRAANFLWDYDSCLEIGMRAVQVARDTGALEILAAADNACGQAAAFGGDFAHAVQLIAEVDAVKEATRTRIAPHAAIALAGIRGQEAEASELIDGIITEATGAGQGTAVQYARWANSVLMNGLARYEEALAGAVEASEDTPELSIAAWALSELTEAATRTGNAELANGAVARLGEQTEATDADWALGLHARARALLSGGEAAERLYREAIDRLGRTRLRPELARAHLLYGEWLRRENRRVDARAQLRAAHELFVTIGMEAFAERARKELLATGDKVRKRTEETRDELTAQERQIARLARDGLSNPEIGARLFLSPRTVEWHLHKVFTKLGIRSRRELSSALPSFESELAPARSQPPGVVPTTPRPRDRSTSLLP